MRVLKLQVYGDRTSRWFAGLQELLKSAPRSASPAHWRWALSCMRAASERGTKGFLRQSELKLLLRCANASPGEDTYKEALKLLEEGIGQFGLSKWGELPSSRSSAERLTRMSLRARHTLLDAQQLAVLLFRLSISSQTITDVFAKYASSQTKRALGFTQWLSFVHSEQLASLNGDDPNENVTWLSSDLAQQWEIGRAKSHFERATADINPHMMVAAKGLELHQLAFVLLSSENNAISPARAPYEVDGVDAPLAHCWTACSHNSCTPSGIEPKTERCSTSRCLLPAESLARSRMWQTSWATSSLASPRPTRIAAS